MSSTLVVATRAGNVTRCATGRGVYESASRINAIPRAGSKEDRKGHGRHSRNTKRRQGAQSVDQDRNEKAEQRETIEARHDAPEQCQNPSVAGLSCGEGTDHTQRDRKRRQRSRQRRTQQIREASHQDNQKRSCDRSCREIPPRCWDRRWRRLVQSAQQCTGSVQSHQGKNKGDHRWHMCLGQSEICEKHRNPSGQQSQ